MSAEPLTGAVLDFEKPILELEVRIARLRSLLPHSPDLAPQIDQLKSQVENLQRKIFAHLTRWQMVQLARHASRPSPLDYLDRLAPDFVELHGDRALADDPALVGGPATVAGRPVMLVAHARGRTHEEQEARRFAMTRPEGFRKAVRLFSLADRLGLPLVTFIDTPSAYPGDDAEEHGQALQIATALERLARVRVPVVACVVGEGGSGGALALSVSDRLLMQQYAIFAVISPEACSSILYRTGTHAHETAEALQLTSNDLIEQRLIDEIVPEPAGGAHRDLDQSARLVGDAIARALDELAVMPTESRLEARYRRLRAYGSVAYHG